MRKYLLIALGVFVALSASFAGGRGDKKTKGATPLPPFPELSTTLDSIIREAWNLYDSERVNWIASDLAMEKYRENEVGGFLSWLSDDSVQCAIFFDNEKKNCILEYKYDKKTYKSSKADTIRPLTAEELATKQRQDAMLNAALKMYGDSLLFAGNSFGSPNIDVIRINDKITRIYFLQGTIQHNVIPFGNDYSIDVDENLQPVAFRRYHNSLIAIRTKSEDGADDVVSTMHSHLKDNPFITPTDICNFLLYRPRDMDMFVVLSTAFNCRFLYSAERNNIDIITE